jgi:uncharacterized protein (UPF0332 family)
MPDDPVAEMELAGGALTDADALRQQGTDRGAIGRLYYACFHAAQAVLYDKGFSPESHDAVKRLFGREVVITGGASRSDGEFLSDMYDRRREADYKQSFSPMNVNALYARTESFVNDMADLIEDRNDANSKT